MGTYRAIEENWDKLIEDNYLVKKTGFVEAWKVIDSKASKIGQAEYFVEAKQQFCNGGKNWKMSYGGI